MTDQPTTDPAVVDAETIDRARLFDLFSDLPTAVAGLATDRNGWIRNAHASYAREDAANRRWLDAAEELAKVKAQRDQAIADLEEASAVIILAGRAVEVEHPAWVILDDYDGSRDSCREVEALGFTRSGDGSWLTAQPVTEVPHPSDGTQAEPSSEQDGAAA